MITIVLPVSRSDYLELVLTSLELLKCDPTEVNLLVIVDGDNALFVKTPNLVGDSKFTNRLVVASKYPGSPTRYSISDRRKRIAAHHNQARGLISHSTGYVFSVEDDTTFDIYALERLIKVAINNRAFGMVTGVELGRWGVPYVGAWKADDIYDPKKLISVKNNKDITADTLTENIDASGLYCALIRTDLYKQHKFNASNGLGPDINFGLELRQLGFQNFIAWNVQCAHHYSQNGINKKITPEVDGAIVSLIKKSERNGA